MLFLIIWLPVFNSIKKPNEPPFTWELPCKYLLTRKEYRPCTSGMVRKKDAQRSKKRKNIEMNVEILTRIDRAKGLYIYSHWSFLSDNVIFFLVA